MSNKKINCGKETLIPKNRWVNEDEIQGNDEKVLKHPIINEAFEKIIEEFCPKHDTAFMSLCTATRPYSKSPKWKKFIELYSDKADLIICSNGGIIPIEFEDCYPYLTYDAHGQKKYDDIYIEYTYNRLMKFFQNHHYKNIIFNFRPTLRNKIAALKFKENFHFYPVNIYIVPTENTWEELRKYWKENNKIFHYFPDIEPIVLKEINSVIKKCDETT